jgi:hypothetical protein
VHREVDVSREADLAADGYAQATDQRERVPAPP